MIRLRKCMTALVTCLFASAGAAGCGSQDSAFDVQQAEIENDAQIQVEAGSGAGVYVEYYSGGDWYVYTTCDTAKSGFGCQFDIDLYIPEGNDVHSVLGDALEFSEDDLYSEDNLVQLRTWTYDDFDGVTFSAKAGLPLRIDFTLDDYVQPEVLFWNGHGAIQNPAPSMPLDLEPQDP